MNEEEVFVKLTKTRYHKAVPASGKSVFKYHGIKLVHRSTKEDGCDYLLHDGLILMVMPSKTERLRVYELLETRWDRIRLFIDWSKENDTDSI